MMARNWVYLISVALPDAEQDMSLFLFILTPGPIGAFVKSLRCLQRTWRLLWESLRSLPCTCSRPALRFPPRSSSELQMALLHQLLLTTGEPSLAPQRRCCLLYPSGQLRGVRIVTVIKSLLELGNIFPRNLSPEGSRLLLWGVIETSVPEASLRTFQAPVESHVVRDPLPLTTGPFNSQKWDGTPVHHPCAHIPTGLYAQADWEKIHCTFGDLCPTNVVIWPLHLQSELTIHFSNLG